MSVSGTTPCTQVILLSHSLYLANFVFRGVRFTLNWGWKSYSTKLTKRIARSLTNSDKIEGKTNLESKIGS